MAGLRNQALGKDGKAYTVSTVKFRSASHGELWETSVFTGKGCLAPMGHHTIYMDYTMSAGEAPGKHAKAMAYVAEGPLYIRTWQECARLREEAIALFNMSAFAANMRPMTPEERRKLYGGPEE